MNRALKAQADLLKALAHPTRLHILEILGREEACVCHLTSIIKQRQANVSQHLMVLREAGVVQDRKDGVLVYYSLVDERVLQAVAMLSEVLRMNGKPLAPVAVPSSPVPGCPCPKCEGLKLAQK
jgi:DNA-binding transcriptional ArsR family regulator